MRALVSAISSSKAASRSVQSIPATAAFFEKHGPKTIILARFVPIVRTFTPVLAGVSYMRYPVFLAYDIVGGILWGGGVTLLGYFLGNVPFVKNNLELMILLIVFLSILPGISAVGRNVLRRRGVLPKEH